METISSKMLCIAKRKFFKHGLKILIVVLLSVIYGCKNDDFVIDDAKHAFFSEDIPRVIFICEKLIEKEPDNPVLYFLLYATRGSIEDAKLRAESKRHFHDKESLQKIHIWAQRNFDQYPHTAGAEHLYALASYFTGDYQTAIKHWESMSRMRERLGLKKSPEEYALLSNAYLEIGEREKAFSLIQKAFELAPDNYKIISDLANFYHETGDFVKAERYYKEVIEMEPNYANAPYNLGLLYQKQKKFKEALDMFGKALEIIPDMTEALYAKGYIFIQTGKRKEAKKTFEKILKIDSNNQYAIEGIEWLKNKQNDMEISEVK